MADDNESEGGKKSRSPRFPSRSLETCEQWARKIYDSEKRNVTTATLAARAMGFGSLSGASRAALAAMKQFGLLVEEGKDKVRVSDEAVRLLLAPDDSQRLQARQVAARSSVIIAELIDYYRGDFPSDETIVYWLVTERGFGEEAARTLVRVLRETVAFASLDQKAHTADMAAPDQPERRDPSPMQSFLSGAGGFGFAPAKAPPPPPASPPPSKAALHVELSDGTTVDIHASGPLNADTLDELKDYIDVYEKVLRKRAAAERAAPHPTGSDEPIPTS